MPNPLDYITKRDLTSLGLDSSEVASTYQPSGGGTYHARGSEGAGKTLWIMHLYRYLIDKCGYSPSEAVGNLTVKGKYGQGFQTLKGEDLHEYLWKLTHEPYTHKIVIIDEIDSEFPARFFASKEQTEIALRMWHVQKLHNYVLMTSHLGKGSDLIFYLSTQFLVIPRRPNFQTNSMNFTLINGLNLTISNWTAHDIIRTMLIYNRRELTEGNESDKPRYKKTAKKEVSSDHTLDTSFEFEEIDEKQLTGY